MLWMNLHLFQYFFLFSKYCINYACLKANYSGSGFCGLQEMNLGSKLGLDLPQDSRTANNVFSINFPNQVNT